MKIEHIDDVLDAIEGRTDFVVKEKNGYTVIDYVYTLPDSFDHPMRAECRGLKFRPDGSVLARPFAKFFNVGEKEHTQLHKLDFEAPHLITDKLDGSMIHPAMVNGEWVAMTRMGITDVAQKAQKLITPRMRKTFNMMETFGYTPIFEYTGPDNRIVVPYSVSALTLLAVRNKTLGTYLARDRVENWAEWMGAPVVYAVNPNNWSTPEDFIAHARALKHLEGFVVQFASGLWVKIKADDYVLKHKSKEMIGLEKNALALILSDGVDDILPLLDHQDKVRMLIFYVDVVTGIEESAKRVRKLVDSGAHLDQKAFAVEHLAEQDPHTRALCFMVRNGKGEDEAVKELIGRNLKSGTTVEAVRHIFNARMEQ